jgi:hypothetical protein
MRSYHGFLAGGATMLGGFVATIMMDGDWQAAVATAVSVFGVMVFLLSFISLGVAADRPRSDRAERALSGRRKAPSGQRRDAPVRASTVESSSRAAVGEATMEPAAIPSS